MIFKPSQVKAFNDAKAECEKLEAHLQFLESLASQAPEYYDKVKELREIVDHANLLAACGVAACGGCSDAKT